MSRFHHVLLLTLLVSTQAPDQRTDRQPSQQPISEAYGQISELHLVSAVKGWFVNKESLRDYEFSPDHNIKHGGESGANIKSISLRSAAGVLRQTIKSDHYRGMRLRFSGYVRSEVSEGWAGLWMRVDGERGQRLGLDNMQNRPIKMTTDWTKYEIVLEVPVNSIALTFGIVLAGKGEVWADDLRIEVAGPDVPTSDVYGKSQTVASPQKEPIRGAYARRLLADLKDLPLEPANLDFEDKK
jgi:hypothetical protein